MVNTNGDKVKESGENSQTNTNTEDKSLDSMNLDVQKDTDKINDSIDKLDEEILMDIVETNESNNLVNLESPEDILQNNEPFASQDLDIQENIVQETESDNLVSVDGSGSVFDKENEMDDNMEQTSTTKTMNEESEKKENMNDLILKKQTLIEKSCDSIDAKSSGSFLKKNKHLNAINLLESFKIHSYGHTFTVNKSTMFKVFGVLILSLFFIGLEYFIGFFKTKYTTNKFLYSFFTVLIRIFVIWMGIFFAIKFLYILFQVIITSRKLINLGAFLEFTLISFETSLVLFISMIVLETVKKLYFNSIISGVVYQYVDRVYLNYWEHCLKIFLNVYLDKFLGVITNIINIYLIFNIFIVLVDANLYFSRFKSKIVNHKPIVKFLGSLDTLNDEFPNKTSLNTSEFEEYSSTIYDKLTDNSILNINHFRLKFGVEKGNDFFKYFDPDFSNNIPKKEFVKRHKSLVIHSISLHKSIISNRKSIDNLQTVTNILSLIPISFMISTMFVTTNTKETVTIIASATTIGAIIIIPLKSVLQDIFYSFFYAFVVRPFDINDIIIIDKKYSRCLELGIFKSAFLTEGRYEIIETKSIGDQMIYTLENTNSVTFTVQKKFKLQAFDKYNELKEMIYEYLKFNPHMFRIQHCVYYLIEENSVMISVEYNCVCRYQELDFANHCSKKFQSKFHDMTESLEMVYA